MLSDRVVYYHACCGMDRVLVEGEWCLYYSVDGMYCIITLAPRHAVSVPYRNAACLLACLSEQPNRCSTVLTVPHLPVQSDRPYAYGTGTATGTGTVRYGTKKYSTGIGPPARTVPVPCSYRRFRGSGAAGADYLNTNSMSAALPVLVELSVHMPLRYTQRVRVGARRGAA